MADYMDIHPKDGRPWTSTPMTDPTEAPKGQDAPKMNFGTTDAEISQRMTEAVRGLGYVAAKAYLDVVTDRDAAKARIAELETKLSYSPYDHVAHEDDHAVNRFAVAMKGKLEAKRLQGRGGWADPEVPNGYLSRLLREHVDKGDPVDVANFAMMIHQRQEKIAPQNEGATCAAIEAAQARAEQAEAEAAKADVLMAAGFAEYERRLKQAEADLRRIIDAGIGKTGKDAACAIGFAALGIWNARAALSEGGKDATQKGGAT